MTNFHDHPEPRHELPNRRLSDTLKLKTLDGITVHLSIGFDPTEINRPREVFYSSGFRSGTQLEFLIQDACVLISILLQHGHKPEDICKSLSSVEKPDADGEIAYASIIGMIAEALN